MSNFRIVVTMRGRPWPFAWGPFGRDRRVEVDLAEGHVAVYQRDGGKLAADPVEVVLYRAPDRLVATVGFRGSARVRRITQLPCVASREPMPRRAS